MKRGIKTLSVIIFGLILCISIGLAQESQKEVTIEEIVVTATKTEKRVDPETFWLIAFPHTQPCRYGIHDKARA